MSRSPAWTGEQQSVQANGLDIGYASLGSGPPLVLIHGAEADRGMFLALGQALAAHFTVIAYDQRDSGATRDRSDPPRAYGLADLADDLAVFIHALGWPRAHVFGTSLGGHIAQVLAMRHPGCIDRLILASTFLAGHELMDVHPEAAARLAGWRGDQVRHAPDIASMFFPPAFLALNPTLVEMFRGGRRTPEQAARRARLLDAPYAIGPGDIGHKTLVLMGEADALIPNSATLAVARLVRAPRIEVMPGVGHIAAIQAPEELALRVRSFLCE